MAANGLQGTLLSLRASLEGFSPATTGVVMSAYFLGMLFGSAAAGRLLGAVGHIRVFAGLASLASVCALIHGAFVDVSVWICMRFIAGFCFAGLFVTAESWLNVESTNESRGKLLSVYMVVVFLGMAGGQLLLAVADPRSIDLFIVVSALVSVAMVPMLLLPTSAPVILVPERLSLPHLYRLSPLGVVGALVSGAAHGALFGLGAVYAQQRGLSTFEVAVFMAAPLVGGVISQFPIGRWSDRFDRRSVVLFVSVLATLASYWGISETGATHGGLFLVMLCLGATTLPLYALFIAHTNDALAPEQMVNASGTLVLASGLGLFAGPLLVSQAMAWFGGVGFFGYLVVVHLTVALFAAYRMTRRKPLPVEEQAPYVAVVRSSTVLTELALETGRETEREG